MPFRCKCGRTFEKPDTFSTHTSGCAPFHQRKASFSSQVSPSSKVTPLEISRVQQRISIRPTRTISSTSTDQSSPSSLPSSPLSATSSPTCSSSPSMDYPVFMPTALSIQNAFEGVRRRSLSYGVSLK